MYSASNGDIDEYHLYLFSEMTQHFDDDSHINKLYYVFTYIKFRPGGRSSVAIALTFRCFGIFRVTIAKGLTFLRTVELISVADDRQCGGIRHLPQGVEKFPALHQQNKEKRQQTGR